MNQNNLTHPHDHFFKQVFSRKEEVTDFIRGTFPKHLVKNLKLETLQLDTTSYVDKTLKAHFSDIVYQCDYGENNSLRVALLFEHKSYAPTDFPIYFQLLKYMLRIWEQNYAQKEPFMVVIPVIVYQGKAQWELKPIWEYLEDGDQTIDPFLHQYLPQFSVLTTNLPSLPDHQIQNLFELATLRTALLLMKYIFSKNLLERLEIILKESEPLLANKEGQSFLDLLLLYLYYGSNLKVEQIMEKVETISPKANQVFKSTAEQLIEKGIEQGIEKGIEQGIEKGIYKKAVEMVIKLHKKGVSTKEIADLVGFSEKEVKKIINY